jgi:hypothetical protein
MTLTQTLPETDTADTTDRTDTAAAPLPGTTTETAAPENTPASSDDDALKLDGLYNSASRLEVELEGVVRRNTTPLTAGQVGGFNAILKMARQLLPKSVALREDVDEIDGNTRPTDAHQALHVTIVPTLHNALPEPLYEKHG